MKKTKLLFYYPSNNRSNVIETILIGLREKGFDIHVLTTCEKGDLHDYLNKLGFVTESNVSTFRKGPLFYLSQIVFLAKYCKRKKIDVVFSNLQQANIISVFAQYFVRSKFIIFRHHFRSVSNVKGTIEVSRNERRFDYIINKLAKTIVVPSENVKKMMLENEKVSANKIKVVPYVYDFSKYEKPDEDIVKRIRNTYSSSLLLIMVSRMIKLKRHLLVFETVKKLAEEGIDVKLMVLDDGPERKTLENYIRTNKLENKIFLLGYRTDLQNYMFASDVLIQPSLTDASNSVAKEMALFQKTIVATDGVGDYNEYIIDGKNGFLIPQNVSQEELRKLIISFFSSREKLLQMGKELQQTVISKFAVSEEGIKRYLELIN